MNLVNLYEIGKVIYENSHSNFYIQILTEK
jgi:hypothetical protein